MEISHFLLYQARCVGCGVVLKADIPSAHATGYGPRLTALIGELGGMHRTSRRRVQAFCHSVLHIPLSLGAIQKIIDRYAFTGVRKVWLISPPPYSFGTLLPITRTEPTPPRQEPG
jgi:hypothetical protein